MPILENSQHERFAQELAQGSSASAAFVAAGYKAHASNASRLSANDKVRARVKELQLGAAEETGLSVQWVLAGLRSIAEREEAKDSDRNTAFIAIGKHLGMFVEQSEVKVVRHDISAEPLSLDEWEANAAISGTAH